jgi:hypothetical protein
MHEMWWACGRGVAAPDELRGALEQEGVARRCVPCLSCLRSRSRAAGLQQFCSLAAGRLCGSPFVLLRGTQPAWIRFLPSEPASKGCGRFGTSASGGTQGRSGGPSADLALCRGPPPICGGPGPLPGLGRARPAAARADRRGTVRLGCLGGIAGSAVACARSGSGGRGRAGVLARVLAAADRQHARQLRLLGQAERGGAGTCACACMLAHPSLPP